MKLIQFIKKIIGRFLTMGRKLKIKSKEEKRIEANELDLAAMTFESMMDKMKIAALEDTTAQLTFEIMSLKMEGN